MSDTSELAVKLFDIAQNLRDTGARLAEDGWKSTGLAIIDYCRTLDEAADLIRRTIGQLEQRAEKAEREAKRYATVRLLRPTQFAEIFRANIEQDIPFDDLIDNAASTPSGGKDDL